MKIKSWIKIAVVAVLIVLVACLALNGIQIGKYIVTPVGDAISLGLDLQGGISTVYVAKDSSVENFDSLMESTISVLRTRLTNAGYTEATVARQGSDAIRVEIPDVDDPQQVVDIIGKPAHLEFRDPNGNVILEGANIESCGVGYDETTGQAYVGFQLDAEGTKAFADATSEFMGKTIAIYLDGEVISSPTVQSVIPNGQGSITMGNLSVEESKKESQELALLIQSGALPLDIEESETRAISATLGFEAIDDYHVSPARRGRQHGAVHLRVDRVLRPGDFQRPADPAGHRRYPSGHRHGRGRQRHHLRALPRGV